MTQIPDELAALSRKSQAIWDGNAAFWDEYMGEGRGFQRRLIGPATERLLGLRAGETALDIACGNGAFSRRMAELGVRVVACDFSVKFIELAKVRTTVPADCIEYRVIDATDEAQILTLGRRRFDAAVCTMGLMDMATIEPLMVGLSQLLKVGGRFVFSVMHPCFNSNGTHKVMEEEDRDGEIVTTLSIRVSRYARSFTHMGLGIIGQPMPQYYFHRPLGELLGVCFRAGFVMDGIEEPVFDESASADRPLGWGNYREIPPVLVARMRLVS